MAQLPPGEPDPVMREYLDEANLSALDLDAVDLADEAAAERRWLGANAALCLAGGLLVTWSMGSRTYLFYAPGTPLVAAAWSCLALAAWGLGRSLWGLRAAVADYAHRSGQQAAAAVGAAIARRERHVKGTADTAVRRLNFGSGARPSPAGLARLRRMASLALGLGAMGAVVLLWPNEPQWQGNGYGSAWFLAVALSLVAGISLGRWLVASAEAARVDARRTAARPTPWQLPAGSAWAALALLVAGALVAAFGQAWLGEPTRGSGFWLSGVGMAVGIGGAIWIAGRFDAWEDGLRRRRGLTRRPP